MGRPRPTEARTAAGRWAVVVTVEHGGNRVPAEHAELFRPHAELLATHRAWDPGTRSLGRELAERLGAPLVEADVTRLLVDLNRSPHNPRVFSQVTRGLPRRARAVLLATYHRPHWERARNVVSSAIASVGRVLHLGIHSFTPVLEGRVRRPDVAFLYDPARTAERALAAAWKRELAARSGRVIGRNDPYRGDADGLTTVLRRTYPQEAYLGIEVEVNQRHVGADGAFPAWVADGLVASLERILDVRGRRGRASERRA